MALLIIVNNAAAKARRVWPTARALLASAGINYESYETTSRGDATLRTRAALNNGVSTVAVLGGDGTLSEAAEGFFEFKQGVDLPTPINRRAALGILPAGTGDDFARGLTNGKRAPVEHWVNILMTHCQQRTVDHTKLIDVLCGFCNDYRDPFICLNASTMGIGGETATRVAAQGNFMRQLSGEIRFAAAALVSIARWRERRVRVSVDGQTLVDGPINLAAVANALYAGGGMILSPEARFDDGKLDVITASDLTRVAVLRELGRIHKGGHVHNPKVKIAQGTAARIETFAPEDAMPIEIDGNVRGVTPVTFRILPKALRFIV